MKFNYNDELKNMLNNIYKYKLFEAVYDNFGSIDINNMNDIESTIKNTKVYLGSDMHEYIINLIPNDVNGYYFRCEISKHYNHSFPRLYNYDGKPLKTITSTKFAIQLWESHMNDLLIEDLENKFNQCDFYEFVDNNFKSMINDINEYISNKLLNDKIIIKFDSKENLLTTVKQMILDGKLDLSWAEMMIDFDSLRGEMVKYSAAFHIYNEFDKLEDDLEYCINTFCKYNSHELYDLLINEKGFVYTENIGLVR